MTRASVSRSALCATVAVVALPFVARAQSRLVSVGVHASAFPGYVTQGDAHTRTVGGTIAGRAWSAGRPFGFEIAFSHVPQAPTNQSSAPTLTVLRAGLMFGQPARDTQRVGGHFSVGVGLFNVKSQPVDCGDFPECDEWGSWDVTAPGAIAGVGVEFRTFGRLLLQADARGYLSAGAWNNYGHRFLQEASIGLALRL